MVDVLISDEWDGSRSVDDELRRPTFDAIANALSRLDQVRHTLVTLVGSNGSWLGIGGGSGSYFVAATMVVNEEEHYYKAVRDENATIGIVPLVVGGQLSDYPKNEVFDLKAAMSMAEAFFKDSVLDRRFSWISA